MFYIVDNVFVTEDISKKYFLCDLSKCKGACCKEGDKGAPLLKNEISQIRSIESKLSSILDEESKEIIKRGLSDEETHTPLKTDKSCVYSLFDPRRGYSCAIEYLHHNDESAFKKPLSCELYPLRVQKLADGYEALNFHAWTICNCALTKGNQLQVPLFQFLKNALIRAYSKGWYDRLLGEIKDENLVDFYSTKEGSS